VLTAMGPGSDKVHGLMENSDLFRVMAEALALSPQEKSAPKKANKK
jgi:alkaline phosphatase